VTPQPAWRAATPALALGALLALGAQAVLAAATPVNSTPTRYAALIHAPRVIRMRFSEAIVKQSSDVSLTDLTGRPVPVTPVKTRDKDSLEVRIAARLGPGVYMVHWTAVSAVDGSKARGRYQFTIQ
jgi:methionine-rich copper-binding protein CopC